MSWQDKELARIRKLALAQELYRPEAPVISAVLSFAALVGFVTIADLCYGLLTGESSAQPSAAIHHWRYLFWGLFGLGMWFRGRSLHREYMSDQRTYDNAALAMERNSKKEMAL
ncbi:MAG: hypothetical protein EAZ24_13260 [Burkholderiales bacterium]|nr:MAG: hypothetical protein EAZ24_13260 [Burkholderiales bacterium]